MNTTPVVLMLFLAIGLIVAPLFALYRYTQAETRRRAEVVKRWQEDVRVAFSTAHVVVMGDNALILVCLNPKEALYVVAHMVCGRTGESHSVEETPPLPFERARDVLGKWEAELADRSRYRSGLLYPPYDYGKANK